MNIHEVAKRASVSPATVSRTINDSDKVAPKTAQRVRRAIQELGFYPDTNARALGSGRSRLYGLIISDITNPFFPELVRSFEEAAVTRGQDIVIANTGYDPARTELCVQRMLERKVDGVAIMTSEMARGLLQRLRSRQIPMVFLHNGQRAAGALASNIFIDFATGIDAAIRHLAALGHQRIAFISGPMSLGSARRRHDAFLASLKRCGIAINRRLVVEGNHRVDGGRMAMQKLLVEKKQPTAILSSNDLMAIGAIGAILEAGFEVPRDFSVIGCDDIEISAFLHPPMTTIRVSRKEIAEYAFDAIYAARQNRDAPVREYTVSSSLIVRESTARVSRRLKQKPE